MRWRGASNKGPSAPGGTRTPDPRIRRRKGRVQPALPCVVWCCCVRAGKRFAPNHVLPVGLCVVLSGAVRLQNSCNARLYLTLSIPDPAGGGSEPPTPPLLADDMSS